MRASAVKTVFQEVFLGKLQAMEASIALHKFCNQKNINPAYEKPITMLMMTENGREKLRFYEDFIMKINWLLTKLSIKEIEVEEALDEFQIELDVWEELGLIPDQDELKKGRVCPSCGR